MGLIQKLTNIATAISNKTGEPASEYTIDNMPDAIDSIQTSFPEPEPEAEWAVRFIDPVDGSILHELTYDQLPSLTSLPELPDRSAEHLVATGWTSSLSAVRTVRQPNKLEVGAEYITNFDVSDMYPDVENGDTTVLEVFPGITSLRIYLKQTVANGVTIDWGDGSTASTSGSTVGTPFLMSHTFSTTAPGVCYVKVMPERGCDITFGYNSASSATYSSAYNMFGHQYKAYGTSVPAVESITFGRCSLGPWAIAFNKRIKHIYLSNRVTNIGSQFMYNNRACDTIIFPSSISTIEDYALYSSKVKHVVIPSSVTFIGNYFMDDNTELESIVIPSTVANIGSYFFDNNKALKELIWPDSLTALGGYAFYNNVAPLEYKIPLVGTGLNVERPLYNNSGVVSIYYSPTAKGPGTMIGNGNEGQITMTFKTDVVSTFSSQNFQYMDTGSVIFKFDKITSTFPFSGSWNPSDITIQYVDLTKQTVVPTVSSSSTLNYWYCPIVVPDNLYTQFKSATNWSAKSQYFIKKSDWEKFNVD